MELKIDGKIEKWALIDPETGIDYLADYLGNHSAFSGRDETGDWKGKKHAKNENHQQTTGR
jgi:hypothetical protein